MNKIYLIDKEIIKSLTGLTGDQLTTEFENYVKINLSIFKEEVSKLLNTNGIPDSTIGKFIASRTYALASTLLDSDEVPESFGINFPDEEIDSIEFTTLDDLIENSPNTTGVIEQRINELNKSYYDKYLSTLSQENKQKVIGYLTYISKQLEEKQKQGQEQLDSDINKAIDQYLKDNPQYANNSTSAPVDNTESAVNANQSSAEVQPTNTNVQIAQNQPANQESSPDANTIANIQLPTATQQTTPQKPVYTYPNI